jgi:hypothetical protein
MESKRVNKINVHKIGIERRVTKKGEKYHFQKRRENIIFGPLRRWELLYLRLD